MMTPAARWTAGRGTQPVPRSADEGHRVACEINSQRGENALCLDDGNCQACDVTCPGGTCAGTKLQAAIHAGGTVYVCSGRYTGAFALGGPDVTVIGAGQGDDERFATILDARGAGIVVRSLIGGSFALHRLRITGGSSGGVFNAEGTASLVDCTITVNRAGSGGGIMSFNADTTLTRCTVSFNAADDGGGTRHARNGKLTLRDCRIANNTAETVGGGVAVLGLAELINCEVTENTRGEDPSGRAGGIAVTYGEGELKNSFVWGFP